MEKHLIHMLVERYQTTAVTSSNIARINHLPIDDYIYNSTTNVVQLRIIIRVYPNGTFQTFYTQKEADWTDEPTNIDV